VKKLIGVVVLLVGGLGALGLPAFRRYMRIEKM
jgi:hypothetical protein